MAIAEVWTNACCSRIRTLLTATCCLLSQARAAGNAAFVRTENTPEGDVSKFQALNILCSQYAAPGKFGKKNFVWMLQVEVDEVILSL